MTMDMSRQIVAILLGVTVLLFVMMHSEGTMALLGHPRTELSYDDKATEAWSNILSAIIGALSVYIAGGGKW